MTVLLALDIATHCGFARGSIAGHRATTPIEAASGVRAAQPEGGTRAFRGPLGEAMARFADWLWRTTEGVDLLAYECPILPRTTTIDTIRRLDGLAGIAAMVAHKRGLPEPLTPQPAEIKRHWAGSGRAEKTDMVKACRDRGWTCVDDNHADALALWDFTVAQIAAGLWRPKSIFRPATVGAKIDAPRVRRKGAA
ncbi:hypothetical protein F1188_11130 [Roseospira marina]|uniref:Uncharacterized protein n=1 Tax=Roseospira marina TaxID=140057 RepID=A0A5M6ICH1_9PROT|nr:hypothetical protein [Roseospira marina]KAA5605445.1 hypothetical protein F1188_11130 [Roseospira marina]MBB4314558.1 hypothetical protein [Roseospira marina]MBB5088880.1 hypothetical protein [Roseospira marina]